MSSTQEIYIKGLSDLRDGALLLIIASIVSIIAGAVLYSYLHNIETYLPSLHPDDLREIQRLHRHVEEFAGVILAVLVAVVFASIIQLIAIFAKIIPGSSKLARVDPDYTTPSTLIKIGYLIGLIIAIVGFAVMILAVVIGVSASNIIAALLGALGGIVLLVVAFIFLIIGEVGFILLSFKLGEKEIQSEYTIVAVLLIIWLASWFLSLVFAPAGAIGGVIELIAFILLYYALSKTIEKRKTMPSTPPVSQQPVPPPL